MFPSPLLYPFSLFHTMIEGLRRFPVPVRLSLIPPERQMMMMIYDDVRLALLVVANWIL